MGNTIEEFDASLAKHDEIFSSEDMKPTEEEAAKPKNSDLISEKQEHIAENVSIDVAPTSGENLEPKESTLSTKENETEEARSAKAQYAALGIDVSEESSLETESEWEASRKAKKIMENAKTDNAKKINLDKNGNSILNQEESEDSKRNIEEAENEREKDKNDSEFISDESFSLNTEERLEELEEMRLKEVEE